MRGYTYAKDYYHFLGVYFICFFGFAVIFRNFVVAKRTGVNAFKLNQKTGAESITGWYFKFLTLVSILVFILYCWQIVQN